MTSVLFVCHSNAVCSPIAEALLKHLAADRYQAISAGVQPTDIDPLALAALQQLGVSTEGLYGKGLDSVEERYFDIVISLCEQAEDVARAIPANQFMAWHFEDAQCCSRPQAAKVVHEIFERIKLLVLVQDRKGKPLW
ncbi:low molecular weight phosphatase family protein [Oceanisphaera psychrotolerans]|uniref:ArsR family transcriptional regulator n=1 Tax=Oceanisphaera psychrotolerans TaxID=1414654 RepID=A0A1J4QFY8_9GAMM|nr:ArsR family transcriptional regulator [Oceanisphaera psychrotolerans]OIN08958.1 ArsR family transcriptional regulator [Oceanisphaera psychrotolerans]